MKFKFQKYYLYLACACVINLLTGLMLLIYPVKNIKIYYYVSAITLLASGILYILSFFDDKKAHYRPGWILPTGIMCSLFTLNFFFGGASYSEIIYSTVGKEVLFTGIILLATSFQYKFLEIGKWWINTVNSLICIAFGVITVIFRMISEENYFLFAAVGFFIYSLLNAFETFIYIKKPGVK